MTKQQKPTTSPKTKQAYEKLYKHELSTQDAFEANHNLVGFFNVLLKIDKRLSQQGNHYENHN